jgi:hypothetical protein
MFSARSDISMYLKKRDIVPVLYAIALCVLIYFHDVFEEFDGVYQLFAGRRLLHVGEYSGWASKFYPPLYPSLIGTGDIVLPGFLSGKVVTGMSALGIIYLSYYFGKSFFDHQHIGVISQILVATNPLFIRRSFMVENHMLDAFLVLTALYYLYIFSQNLQKRYLIVSALFGGLASMVRHTSLVLGPVGIIIIFIVISRNSRSKNIRYKILLWYSTIYSLMFFLIQSPWLIYNYVENGSPLHSWQYLNFGKGVVTDHQRGRWWWSVQTGYDGYIDIISSHPYRYLNNFFWNLVESAYLFVRSSGALAPLFIIVFFRSIIKLNENKYLIVWVFAPFFTIIVSQAFVSSWFFIHISVLFTIISAGIITQAKTTAIINQLGLSYKQVTIAILIINIIIATPLVVTFFHESHTDLVEPDRVATELDEYDKNINNKSVMSANPAYSYHSSSRHVPFPSYYTGNFTELICYENINGSVERYAKSRAIPPLDANESLTTDYVIIKTQRLEKKYPRWSYLLHPESNNIAEGFNLVYQSKNIVIYDVQQYTSNRCQL